LQSVVRNPRRKTDADYSRADRKYLRPAEVEALIRAAKDGRRGARDALMISLAYHHGLRVSELVGPQGLRWGDLDLKAGTITRALRALRSKVDGSSNVFASERYREHGGVADDPRRLCRVACGCRRTCQPGSPALPSSRLTPRGRTCFGQQWAESARTNCRQLWRIKIPRSTGIYVRGVAGLIRGLWD
jgi:hypothetical protein